MVAPLSKHHTVSLSSTELTTLTGWPKLSSNAEQKKHRLNVIIIFMLHVLIIYQLTCDLNCQSVYLAVRSDVSNMDIQR